jgi:Fe2+ transport system protein FeoA
MVSPGEVATVVGVRAGCGLTRRLADMGLVPGTNLRVTTCQIPGPIIIELRGSKLVLGHGIAQKIIVEV